MPYQLECNIEKQDCESRYHNRPNDQGYSKLPFTSQSCVRDRRLPGNVGRCGFPGAPCVVNNNGNDNCAGGADGSLGWRFYSICYEGFCHGSAGANCNGSVECNWGLRCNNTGYMQPGTCGGVYAPVETWEAADGLDFAKEYCLSGGAYQENGSWYCSGGPDMTLPEAPSPPKQKLSKLVIGLIVAVGVLVGVLIIVLACWWKSLRRQARETNALGTGGSDTSDRGSLEEKGDPGSRNITITGINDSNAKSTSVRGPADESESVAGAGVGLLPHGTAPSYGDESWDVNQIQTASVGISSYLPEVQSDDSAKFGHVRRTSSGLTGSALQHKPPAIIPLQSWKDLPVASAPVTFGGPELKSGSQIGATSQPQMETRYDLDNRPSAGGASSTSHPMKLIPVRHGADGVGSAANAALYPPTVRSHFGAGGGGGGLSSSLQPASIYQGAATSLGSTNLGQGPPVGVEPTTDSPATTVARHVASTAATESSTPSDSYVGDTRLLGGHVGDVETAERRLRLLQEEAERTLAEIRKQRSLLNSSGGSQ